MLALLAALWAYAPALRDGFLTKSICANVSYVSEAPSQHDLHPVPTPHDDLATFRAYVSLLDRLDGIV